MSFFTKLMQDAQPKADAIVNATNNVTSVLANNRVVHIAKNMAYKGLVNTVGVGMVLAGPMMNKAKELSLSTWAKVEELATDPKSSK